MTSLFGYTTTVRIPQTVIGETSNQGFGEVRPDDALHFLEVFSGYLAIVYHLTLKDGLT